MTAPTRFDPTGPLPRGITVLEASAGTGKTYTIAALAARYVADGVPLDRLLAVTFTRLATGELRERIRERLVRTERELAAGLTAGADDVDRLLATGAPHEVHERRERLRRALADFDAATITTIHGFSQAVLGTLGVAGDLDRDARVAEHADDLRDQVVRDLYLRRFHDRPPLFDLGTADVVARAAIDLPGVDVVPPSTGDLRSAAESRARLADAAREELGRRKRLAGLLTYDDLLLRLREALDDPDGGPAVAARLRERFEVVLVDEFQDTDPIQWEVLERAFVSPDRSLVLIGDPKQAIYAFRGADVFAYLQAMRRADAVHELDVNWRSDQALVDAHDALLSGAQLGHPDITYRTVIAHEQGRRLHGAPDPAAIRVRVVDRASLHVDLTRGGAITSTSARAFVAVDVAADIAALLTSGAEIHTPEGRRPLMAGDVAVLTWKSANARAIHAELGALEVDAVLAGAGSVFGTAAATAWLRLLEALERPTAELRARAAALTTFLGWTARDLADAGPDDLEGLHARLHRWSRVLRTQGVAALAEAVTREEELPARVLARRGGERELTDLRHVAEQLHRAGTADGLGATALAAWLRERIADARRDDDQERTRRLESDEQAVQLLTIHRSKGLEFPVVYLPDLWDPPWERDVAEPVAFHRDDRRLLDVGLEGASYDEHRRLHRAEERGEHLRLLYVAITRARHQAVLWWAGTAASRYAPLSRLLLDRGADGVVEGDPRQVPTDQRIVDAVERLARTRPGCLSVERVATWPPPAPVGAPAGPGTPLEVRAFDCVLDRTWRRTSYSALTAAAREVHVAGVGSEPEVRGLGDEPEAGEDDPAATPAPGLAGMPAGREVGTAIHRVLELADFAADDLEAELGGHLAAVTARTGIDLGALDDVAGGLAAVLRTPLDALLGGVALTQITRADRLDELAFELPVAGGDLPRGHLTLTRVAEVLRAHAPDGHPVRAYAEHLAAAGMGGRVRGFVTGSIDLVVRAPGPDGTPRYALADYKTNRLAAYDADALWAEMAEEHYVLQALIYLVALHRHLGARLAGYDPDRHLAGVAYLFLRGMPAGGVVTWQPGGALLDALSEVFDA